MLHWFDTILFSNIRIPSNITVKSQVRNASHACVTCCNGWTFIDAGVFISPRALNLCAVLKQRSHPLKIEMWKLSFYKSLTEKRDPYPWSNKIPRLKYSELNISAAFICWKTKFPLKLWFDQILLLNLSYWMHLTIKR